jgi:hypothetical protein
MEPNLFKNVVMPENSASFLNFFSLLVFIATFALQTVPVQVEG